MKVSSIVLGALITNTCGAFVVPQPVSARAVVRNLSASTVEHVTTKAAVENMDAVVMKGPVEVSMEEEVVIPDPTLDTRNRIQPGRFNGVENSMTLPWLPRPVHLDGSHAGDYGFDPLGLGESNDLYTMQESEIRHGRLAMLAAIGWPLSELVAPNWMLQENGCAPSVLNGFNPLTLVATLAFFGGVGFLEYKTALRRTTDTPIGKKHHEDMANIWEYGVAGDYSFDPLDLYNKLGDDAAGRKGLRGVEISHGRWAMMGISAMALQEVITKHPVVENSIFFHPNAVLPLAVVAYVAWSQFYEVSDLAQYPVKVQYCNEGEMKLERIKMDAAVASAGLGDVVEGIAKVSESTGVTAKLNEVTDKIGVQVEEAAGKVGEKVGESIKDIKANMDQTE